MNASKSFSPESDITNEELFTSLQKIKKQTDDIAKVHSRLASPNIYDFQWTTLTDQFPKELKDSTSSRIGDMLLLPKVRLHVPSASAAKIKEDERPIQKVEPFTAAWVGITLAEGVIAWLGGKAFARIVELGMRPEELIDDSVQRFATLIREEFNRQNMLEARTSMGVARDKLNSFMRTDRIEHLDDADTAISNAVNRLQLLGMSAIETFMMAADLRILIWQEYCIFTKSRRHKRRLGEVCAESQQHFWAVYGSWSALHDSGFSNAISERVCVEMTEDPARCVRYENRYRLEYRGFSGSFDWPYQSWAEARDARPGVIAWCWDNWKVWHTLKFITEAEAVNAHWVHMSENLPGWDMERGS